MQEGFVLPVSFHESQLNFPARLLTSGYSYKLEVDIQGQRILFEPDEERNWRALANEEQLKAGKMISRELLEAVALSIEGIMRH